MKKTYITPAIESCTVEVQAPLLGMSVYDSTSSNSLDNVTNGSGNGSSSGGAIWNDAKGNLIDDDGVSWDALRRSRHARRR